jgi:hypothetical protein
MIEVPNFGHTAYRGLHPPLHGLPVFVNEIDTASRDFISRYVLVRLISGGYLDLLGGSASPCV